MISAVRFSVIELLQVDSLLDWILRIALASVCGFAIGFERKSRSKEAGIRTHAIVCMAAALMMIVSKYGFLDVSVEEGGKGVDQARLAAQVISGIGFLGAGIIFVRRDILHGLTTAAGVWATAGIGMAIGAGMYIIGVISTVLLVSIQIILHRPLHAFRENTHVILRLTAKLEDGDTIDKIKIIFDVTKFLQFKTKKTEDGCVADIELATIKQLNAKDLYDILQNNPFLLSIEKNEEM